jgi:hypothetical protein
VDGVKPPVTVIESPFIAGTLQVILNVATVQLPLATFAVTFELPAGI